MTFLKFPEPVSLAILQHVVNTVDIGVGWYIDCDQALSRTFITTTQFS